MGCLFAAEIAPKQGFQKHVPAKAGMVFSVLEKTRRKQRNLSRHSLGNQGMPA
jgi:hypothetical protein